MLQQDLFKMCVSPEFYCILYTLSLQFHKQKKKQSNKSRVCSFSQCECFLLYNNTEHNETKENGHYDKKK